jgi:hypothetical protein
VVVVALLVIAFVFLARRPPRRLQQGHGRESGARVSRRLSHRHGLVSDVQVSWNGPAGELLHRDGRCRNFSPGGLAIELSDSLPVDTPVTLRVPSLNFTGAGVVRHSRPLASGYLVGIGFTRLTRALSGFHTFASPPDKASPSNG